MATDETTTQEKHRQDAGVLPDEPLQLLLERYAELELARQITFLQAAMPGVLERMSPEQRSEFIHSIEPTGQIQ